MIGYTADLGKCFRVLCHARISSLPRNSTTRGGVSIQRGDVVTRAMMLVGARHMHRCGTCVCGVHSSKLLFCMFILGLG